MPPENDSLTEKQAHAKVTRTQRSVNAKAIFRQKSFEARLAIDSVCERFVSCGKRVGAIGIERF
jgi:hypothetical protein